MGTPAEVLIDEPDDRILTKTKVRNVLKVSDDNIMVGCHFILWEEVGRDLNCAHIEFLG